MWGWRQGPNASKDQEGVEGCWYSGKAEQMRNSTEAPTDRLAAYQAEPNHPLPRHTHCPNTLSTSHSLTHHRISSSVLEQQVKVSHQQRLARPATKLLVAGCCRVPQVPTHRHLPGQLNCGQHSFLQLPIQPSQPLCTAAAATAAALVATAAAVCAAVRWCVFVLGCALGQQLPENGGLDRCHCHALAIQGVEGTDGIPQHQQTIRQLHLATTAQHSISQHTRCTARDVLLVREHGASCGTARQINLAQCNAVYSDSCLA